ncbi:MAG: hypothetical protein Q4F95_00685 [Oscillospiraceae bacterium]|nr:hypothetical protein [Oscillospiraceae bacterium]
MLIGIVIGFVLNIIILLVILMCFSETTRKLGVMLQQLNIAIEEAEHKIDEYTKLKEMAKMKK